MSTRPQCRADDGDRYRCELEGGHDGDHKTGPVRWRHGFISLRFSDDEWHRLGEALGRTPAEMAPLFPGEIVDRIEALRRRADATGPEVPAERLVGVPRPTADLRASIARVEALSADAARSLGERLTRVEQRLDAIALPRGEDGP